MRRVAQDDLDYERQNLLRQASEASKTIERIKRTIEETNTAGFVNRSFKTWPEYLREYEILFTQMQKLHESLQDKATYALLRKQRIQPTNPFLPMPTIPGQPPRPTPVMEYLRTKPIEEIQEEIHEIEKKAREKTSSGKDEKGEEDEGKEGLKKLTVRIDGYNAECDRMDKIMGNWNAEQLKSDVSRIMQRETKTSNMTRPPPELQKLVDIPLNGDEVRAKRGKNSKKRMANLHQDLI
mmetsp:Transcript_15482/g.21675  ORF Transcript_15482/g.21675 Transcript_15482/m.21675 type:complete len:238 (+) Transcript_15482:107-820(+)